MTQASAMPVSDHAGSLASDESARGAVVPRETIAPPQRTPREIAEGFAARYRRRGEPAMAEVWACYARRLV